MDKLSVLQDLKSEIDSCTACILHKERKQTVLGRGNPDAPLVFVGEAPGATEDDLGIPFCGKSGRLLDNMIKAMGKDPEKDVYILNINKCLRYNAKIQLADGSIYCPPNMQYKLHEHCRNKYENVACKSLSKQEVIYDLPIITQKNFKMEKSVYCIDVEGTHNFVTIGGVVHNCRPPNNRKPETSEMNACKPFLNRQLDIIKPKVLVALGSTAIVGLCGPGVGITKRRGHWESYHNIPVMPSFHPAFCLRNPTSKQDVWLDLQEVMRFMKEQNSSGEQ